MGKLTVRLLTSRIKQAVPAGVAVGSSFLLNDTAAVLVEASSPKGLATASPNADELLIINSKLTLATLARAQGETPKLLTRMADDDPQH